MRYHLVYKGPYKGKDYYEYHYKAGPLHIVDGRFETDDREVAEYLLTIGFDLEEEKGLKEKIFEEYVKNPDFDAVARKFGIQEDSVEKIVREFARKVKIN